jgi:tetratricopeptide (TPR) repeat protein
LNCETCGAPLKPGNKFCTACGAQVQEGKEQTGEAPPAPAVPGETVGAFEQPAAVRPPPPPVPGKGGGGRGFKSFVTSKTGIIVAVVVALLVVGGIVAGVLFAVNYSAKKKAQNDAVKYAESATEKIEKAGNTLDDIGTTLKAADFTDTSTAETVFEEAKEGSDGAEKDLDAALSAIKKIDTGKLDKWWSEYTSLIKEGCEEGKKGIADLRKALESTKDVAEFGAAVNQGVAAFEQFIDTINAALGQHAANQFAEANATAETALGHAKKAGDYFNDAQSLQPEADLGKFHNNISVAISVTSKFQTACDAAAAGDLARHDVVIDEFNTEKEQINMDMTFDAEAQFGASVNKLVDSMEKHFDKAADLFEEAEELYDDNVKK